MKWILCLLVLAGCGKADVRSDEAPAGVSDLGADSVVAPFATGTGPAAWSDRAGTQAWTSTTLAAVRANFASFEKAKDREDFCPGFSAATRAQREICWLRLVSAVAKFESGFNPATLYKESNGVYSVGLLQLSSGECSGASSVSALKDPLKNLACGTAKMAGLIARYGYVTTADNKHGAAAYWSTLRRPYVSGHLHLGKRTEVARLTAAYREVASPSSRMLADGNDFEPEVQ